MEKKRSNFTGSIGFVLAAAGSAVGLGRNILADRFNWRKYCTPSLYLGREICVTPLHCSYGQIGYSIHFPYTNAPVLEYDWEMNKLTIDDENWKLVC